MSHKDSTIAQSWGP